MERSKLRALSTEEKDIRRRIDALTGKIKPTDAMVQGSIQPLIDKLAKQAKTKSQNDHLAAQHMKVLRRFRPQEKSKIDPAEREAIKAYQNALAKRAKSMTTKPPKVAPGVPMIKSGSIITFDIPPYSRRWTLGSGAVANDLLGNWSTSSAGNDSSFAGVCVFFVPQPGRFPVRFAPYMPHSFDYLISTYSSPWTPWDFSRAHADGMVGSFVSAWDGVEWVEIADVRNTLFDRSVSINDDASDSDETAWGTPQAEFNALGNPFVFALWAWGGVRTSTKDAPVGFGFAQANLSASIPFVVIEQKI